MRQDRTRDPVELFVDLVAQSLGNIEADMQDLREQRDRVEKPKQALELAEGHIAKREFFEALALLEPVVQRMPERTDLADLQRNVQQLWQIQRSYNEAPADKQTAAFASLAETLELSARALVELPERFRPYPNELLARIKTRQLQDLDVLLVAPGVFTERAAWLRRTWPNDSEVERAIRLQLSAVTDSANRVVRDIEAEQFPGSALEWEAYTVQARRLTDAIAHLTARGFLSPGATRLTAQHLGELEKRAQEMRTLDDLCTRSGFSDEDRQTVLRLAARHGLMLLSNNRSLGDEIAALQKRVLDREQTSQTAARARWVELLAGRLSSAQPEDLKGYVEEARRESAEYDPEDEVQKWLRSAVHTVAEVAASLTTANQLVSELHQPQSTMSSVEARVKAADEAYIKANALLRGLQRDWSEDGVALHLQLARQPQWSEFWNDRTAKLRNRLSNHQSLDSLEAVVWAEHLLPLLRECVQRQPDQALDNSLRQIEGALSQAWHTQMAKSGLFDINAARQRIAEALLAGSNQYGRSQDQLAAAWLAMLAVAATTPGDLQGQIVSKALETLDKEGISQMMESMIEKSVQRLGQDIQGTVAGIQRQVIDIQEGLKQERNDALDAMRQLLPSQSHGAMDLKQMLRLLVTMRRVPAGAGCGDPDLRERLRRATTDFSKSSARGADSTHAKLIYDEANILATSIFNKAGEPQ